MQIGIIGYGAYVPQYRISVEEIAAFWRHDVAKIKGSLLVSEKAVAGPDEDAATIAIQAAKKAILQSQIDPRGIGALFVGSESHPYAVKPTGTVVASALGLQQQVMCADLEFACKAGTAALQIGYSMVKAGMVETALSIAADTAQASPGDILEYTAAAGGAAFLVGTGDCIATIDKTLSITTDTPDFWRRNNQKYPTHTGRFTGAPSYFTHIMKATNAIMDEAGMKPSDFAYVVFHQPNGKFPQMAAKKLGFTKEQCEPGLVAPHIGNAYSANSLLGLVAVLDQAKNGDKILVTSYGSGSGSDAFILTVTGTNESLLSNEFNLHKKNISYAEYKKWGEDR